MKDKSTLEYYNEAVLMYTNRVCRFVHKLLQDSDMAKDITQESYLRLWENKDKVATGSYKSWLFTTAYRLSLNYIRKNKKSVGEELIPERTIELENPDLKQVISDSLALLNDVQRTIVVLKDYEGYKYSEIGEILDLTDAQVKVYLFRARKKIKHYIGDLQLIF